MTKVIFVDNEPVCPQCGDPNMLIEIDFGTKLLDGVCFYPDFGWDYRLNCDIDGEDKALHCRECDFKVDIEDVEPVPTHCINCGAEIPMYMDLQRPTLVYAREIPNRGHVCAKCGDRMEDEWAALGPGKPNWWDWLKQKASEFPGGKSERPTDS